MDKVHGSGVLDTLRLPGSFTVCGWALVYLEDTQKRYQMVHDNTPVLISRIAVRLLKKTIPSAREQFARLAAGEVFIER